MTSAGIKMGMAPPHPGTFIRIEALEESGLSVAAAARILGVRRATLSDLVNGNACLIDQDLPWGLPAGSES